MRLFLHPIQVAVRQLSCRRAERFAEKVVKTTNYADSNQRNSSKIRQDHFVSKVGEEAVRQVFLQFGQRVKGPDYRIYHGKQKSWDADLQINGINLAVKTQTQEAASKYGLSWTFQDSPVRKDPILKEPEAWVCFVVFDEKSIYHTCKVFPPFQIKELLFRPPRLAYLKGKKQVVYAADLPNLVH